MASIGRASVIHQTAIHAAAASVLRPASESPSASAKNAYNPSAARGPAASPSQRRRALAGTTASPADGEGPPGAGRDGDPSGALSRALHADRRLQPVTLVSAGLACPITASD